MELDRINDWLWCLRTRIVQAYAVRERDGFNLIDTSTAGQDGAILGLLATIDPRPTRCASTRSCSPTAMTTTRDRPRRSSNAPVRA
jgi:hypothetical protein